MSKRFFLVVLGAIFLGVVGINAQVSVAYENNGNKDMSELSVPDKIYAVEVAPFDEKDLSRRAQALGIAASFDVKTADNERAKYVNDRDQVTLVYEKQQNRCVYSNLSVGPMKDGTKDDAAKYRKAAEQYLAAILGEKSRNYQFISNSYDEVVEKDGEAKYIAFITYRFVPVVDGVPVLGLTANAKVTLGENGKLVRFRSNEPSLREYGTVKTRVNGNAIRKVLEKKVNSADYLPPTQDGVQLKADKVVAKGWTAAYFEIAKAGKRLLYPHVSVSAENHLAANEYKLDSIRSRIDLSMNGSDWPDLDESDISKVNVKDK